MSGFEISVDYSRISARGHGNLVTRVEDVGEASQNLGHGGGEHHVPCREEQRCGRRVSRGSGGAKNKLQLRDSRKSREDQSQRVFLFMRRQIARLTELGSGQNPFVEQDNTRTQGNPQTGPVLGRPRTMRGANGSSGYARNVESRVKAAAGGSSILAAALELAVILGRAAVCHGGTGGAGVRMANRKRVTMVSERRKGV